MAGTLVSATNAPVHSSRSEIIFANIAFGMTLCLMVFGLVRIADQSFHQWKRLRRVTAYMIYIWLELLSSSIMAGLTWTQVLGNIHVRFEFLFGYLVLWVFQIQSLMLIIINRVALVAPSPRIVRRVRWSTVAILSVINITVFCIWIPAQLHINSTYERINNVWGRVETGVFAVVDLSLNIYFIHLVRSSLISNGLTKYVALYRFNLMMICVSLSTDVLLIGSMSFKNPYVYVAIHPVVYLIKLHIELSMADLIAKILKASGTDLPCHCVCHTSRTPVVREIGTRPRHNAENGVDLAPTMGRFRGKWFGWAGRVDAQTPRPMAGGNLSSPQRNVRASPPKDLDYTGLSSVTSSMDPSTLASRNTVDTYIPIGGGDLEAQGTEEEKAQKHVLRQ